MSNLTATLSTSIVLLSTDSSTPSTKALSTVAVSTGVGGSGGAGEGSPPPLGLQLETKLETSAKAIKKQLLIFIMAKLMKLR
jgi:hypothetical protein